MEGSDPSFVDRLTEFFEGPPRAPDDASGTAPGDEPAPVPTAGRIPPLFTFTGFSRQRLLTQPGVDRENWELLFLDLELMNWLLVESDGIIIRDSIADRRVPGTGRRDMLWVTGDTAIGIGRGSPSPEARFLTGNFTRAADFRASPSGGTLAAATGVFCEESIGCCRPSS